MERFITIQARLSNGVLLTVTGADMGVTSTRFTFYGDRALIRTDTYGLRPKEGVLLYPEDEFPALDPIEIEPTAQDDWITAFVHAVRGEIPNPMPPEEGAHVVDLLQAAYRSAAEGGRPIEIEQH
jgi:predicted dehydrogenase